MSDALFVAFSFVPGERDAADEAERIVTLVHEAVLLHRRDEHAVAFFQGRLLVPREDLPPSGEHEDLVFEIMAVERSGSPLLEFADS